MKNYNFCIAWNWEYDSDFVRLLEEACRARGLSLLQVTPQNLSEVLQALANKELSFQVFFDRASDTDARFITISQLVRPQPEPVSNTNLKFLSIFHYLGKLLRKSTPELAPIPQVYHINPLELALHSWDKALTHQAFKEADIPTPDTIILPSYNEREDLPSIELSSLGPNFVIKPAAHRVGGEQEDVIFGATTLEQVRYARQRKPSDKYLLQRFMVPVQLDTRPAWFRVIYCSGQVYPCWWDTITHIYHPVTPAEETCYGLTPLRDIAAKVAGICGLQLFSTEIAKTQEGRFIAIDNVNDQIDLRLKSKAMDGVPDDIVQNIAHRLVALVPECCRVSPPCNPD